MKQVYQCDFCYHTEENICQMKKHEENCSYDPKFRKCFTCEHQEEHGYEYSIPGCALNLDTCKGREEGNCEGWKLIEL